MQPKDVPDVLTRYVIGDCTVCSLAFIAAVIRTTGPRSFGGAGLCAGRWLGGREMELIFVCSRTGVSMGPDILILQRRVMRTFKAKLTYNGLEQSICTNM